MQIVNNALAHPLALVIFLAMSATGAWWLPYLWSCIVRDTISGLRSKYEGTWAEFLLGTKMVGVQTIVFFPIYFWLGAYVFGS